MIPFNEIVEQVKRIFSIRNQISNLPIAWGWAGVEVPGIDCKGHEGAFGVTEMFSILTGGRVT